VNLETLFCAAALAALGAAGASPDARADADARLVQATNDLGFRLYAALAPDARSPNVFVSPLSVQLALAMVWNGAAGGTRADMARSLGYADLTAEDVNGANRRAMAILREQAAGVRTDIANGLWGRAGVVFEPGFLARMRDDYEAEIASLDFRSPDAAGTINGWVDRKTQGKIRQLVDARSVRDVMLVLVNALYFNGRWTEPFPKAATKPQPFSLLRGGSREVPMMRVKRKFRYLRNDALQAVRLPFGPREQAAMYVLLPHPGRFETFARGLTAKACEEWIGAMRSAPGTVVLPRFRAEFGASLVNALTRLGMGVAFGGAANFAGLLPPGDPRAGDLYISDVVHKTVLEVNEEGAEAAAATGVIVGLTAAAPAPPFEMVVDRPFAVLIRHEPTGQILFLGTIGDPR